MAFKSLSEKGTARGWSCPRTSPASCSWRCCHPHTAPSGPAGESALVPPTQATGLCEQMCGMKGLEMNRPAGAGGAQPREATERGVGRKAGASQTHPRAVSFLLLPTQQCRHQPPRGAGARFPEKFHIHISAPSSSRPGRAGAGRREQVRGRGRGSDSQPTSRPRALPAPRAPPGGGWAPRQE